ncbi:MAG: hypothetical protein QOH40_844 [Arthrobacter pascens]|nr:hypothetical protein [Arthrobacter pascens]
MTDISQSLPERRHDGPVHRPDDPGTACGCSAPGMLTCLPWVGLLHEHTEA